MGTLISKLLGDLLRSSESYRAPEEKRLLERNLPLMELRGINLKFNLQLVELIKVQVKGRWKGWVKRPRTMLCASLFPLIEETVDEEATETLTARLNGHSHQSCLVASDCTMSWNENFDSLPSSLKAPRPSFEAELMRSKRLSLKEIYALRSESEEYMNLWRGNASNPQLKYNLEVELGEMDHYDFIIEVKESLIRARRFLDFSQRLIDDTVTISGFQWDNELSWLATFKRPGEKVSASELAAFKFAISRIERIVEDLEVFETLVDNSSTIELSYKGLNSTYRHLRDLRLSCWAMQVKAKLNLSGPNSFTTYWSETHHTDEFAYMRELREIAIAISNLPDEEGFETSRRSVEYKMPKPVDGVVNQGIYISINPEWARFHFRRTKKRKLKYRKPEIYGVYQY